MFIYFIYLFFKSQLPFEGLEGNLPVTAQVHGGAVGLGAPLTANPGI